MSTHAAPGEVPAFELKHRLSLALEVAGLKPENISTELGLSVTTVRNYLSGRTTPKRAVLVAWAFRCGVPIDWLSTGSHVDTPPDDGGRINEVSGSACTRFPQVIAIKRTSVDAQVTTQRRVA